LKANLVCDGPQNVIMLETVGFRGKRDEEERRSIYYGSTPAPASYNKEIGLGCGGRIEGFKG
jgi:hypothetical protein